MKITIKGVEITPEGVAGVLDSLIEDYNLKIKDVTLYVHFQDGRGCAAEPKLPIDGNTLFVKETYQQRKYGTKPLSQELSLERAMMMVENKFQRPLTRLEGPLVQDWVENWHITGNELQAVLDEVTMDSCVQVLDRKLLVKWQRKR